MSLTRVELLAAFPDAVELRAGRYRCKDEVPAFTQHYYVQVEPASGDELLLVTREHTDDEFVDSILAALGPVKHTSRLRIEPISKSSYGFSNVLLVPSTYHGYFRGRLDRERAKLTLAVPIHRCEFTGNESPEDFATMTQDIVAIHNWHRHAAPRIALRFDNPLTGAGADEYVYCTRDMLLEEVRSLSGSNGFIEVENFEARVLEVLSEEPDTYVLIRDRNDAEGQELALDGLLRSIDEFLSPTHP